MRVFGRLLAVPHGRASVIRSRALLVTLIVVGCSSQVSPSSAPGSAAPDTSAAATTTPVVTAPSARTDSPSAGPVDVALGSEALDIVGPMIIFQDLEPGPDAPTGLLASIELDAIAATTASIPQGGGSLSASGSDGTAYTLEIPPTALVTGVEITMTPIASVSTTDETGSAVTWQGALGVRLEPEGLHLFDAASLRIDPSADTDTVGWRGVASASGGVDAHPYPLLADAELLTLAIVHFSEFIVTDGIYLPVEVPSSIPVGAQAQLERDIVAWQEDDGATPEDARAIRDKYWPYVEAILGRSATDCAFAEGGQIARAGGLVRMMSIFNLNAEGDVAAFQEGVLMALENCIREVTEERCFDRNSRHHVNRLIGLVRMAQLLGASDERYEIISAALVGDAPGAALCGDIYGTLVVQHQSSGSYGFLGRTVRSIRTVILDVRMSGGGPYGAEAGSSFTASGTFSETGKSSSGGDCYSKRSSEFGAGALREGSDGQPRLNLETDGSYDLYAPVYSTSYSIVQDCDNYPIIKESDSEGSVGCGPHGQLVGRRDGDVVDFSFSFSNPEETGGRCSVSGVLTVPR